MASVPQGSHFVIKVLDEAKPLYHISPVGRRNQWKYKYINMHVYRPHTYTHAFAEYLIDPRISTNSRTFKLILVNFVTEIITTENHCETYKIIKSPDACDNCNIWYKLCLKSVIEYVLKYAFSMKTFSWKPLGMSDAVSRALFNLQVSLSDFKLLG